MKYIKLIAVAFIFAIQQATASDMYVWLNAYCKQIVLPMVMLIAGFIVVIHVTNGLVLSQQKQELQLGAVITPIIKGALVLTVIFVLIEAFAPSVSGLGVFCRPQFLPSQWQPTP
jgi:hypothetical protein